MGHHQRNTEASMMGANGSAMVRRQVVARGCQAFFMLKGTSNVAETTQVDRRGNAFSGG